METNIVYSLSESEVPFNIADNTLKYYIDKIPELTDEEIATMVMGPVKEEKNPLNNPSAGLISWYLFLQETRKP